MAATALTSPRARTHAILRHSDNSPGGRRWRAFHLFVLGAGLLAVAVSSINKLPPLVEQGLNGVIVLVAGVFLAEYIARLWTAPESPRFFGMSEAAARLRWAVSRNGLIGLLAVLPAFAITTGAVHADSDYAAIFCILWVLKLGAHAPAMAALARVISNESATLMSVLIIFIMVLVAAATATHLLERAGQPSKFGDIPSALWWAVVTLTTTGYGDVVPETVGGKMVGSIVMVSGILVLALMTGILATGFAAVPGKVELTVLLTRIMLPAQAFFFIGGVIAEATSRPLALLVSATIQTIVPLIMFGLGSFRSLRSIEEAVALDNKKHAH